jgi:hypothetical protein
MNLFQRTMNTLINLASVGVFCALCYAIASLIQAAEPKASSEHETIRRIAVKHIQNCEVCRRAGLADASLARPSTGVAHDQAPDNSLIGGSARNDRADTTCLPGNLRSRPAPPKSSVVAQPTK